jgi:hypothetical protein
MVSEAVCCCQLAWQRAAPSPAFERVASIPASTPWITLAADCALQFLSVTVPHLSGPHSWPHHHRQFAHFRASDPFCPGLDRPVLTHPRRPSSDLQQTVVLNDCTGDENVLGGLLFGCLLFFCSVSFSGVRLPGSTLWLHSGGCVFGNGPHRKTLGLDVCPGIGLVPCWAAVPACMLGLHLCLPASCDSNKWQTTLGAVHCLQMTQITQRPALMALPDHLSSK